ncbi:hypothetical protein CVU37_10850 [candidate division BRC1 bacterium HGW-BRC1-1]|nr:MAG: hypothetical protein CVU37_10850 [candidate division BRC1 bacterium HGW-BRC1-1]
MHLPNPLALQMWTLRAQGGPELLAAIKDVSHIGYGAVEFAGFGTTSAKEVRSVMDAEGIVAAGSHVGVDALEKDFDRIADYHEEVQCRNIIVPSPPAGFEFTAESWHDLGLRLAALQPRCESRGLKLGYHNHNRELERFDDAPALDILLKSAGPSVGAELDLYWLAFAGDDPVESIRQRADACAWVHLKDMSRSTPPTDVEVGEGILEWASILQACQDACVEWFVVEMDNPPKPGLESSAIALNNLRKMGVTW